MTLLAYPTPSEPRDQPVADKYPAPAEHIEQAKIAAEQERLEHIMANRRAGAKEALQAICDAYPDGFQVLLAHDKLSDIFGCVVLGQVFNDILSERRK